MCADIYAEVPKGVISGHVTALVHDYDRINFDEIRTTVAEKYNFKNSSVVINNFQDWQTWVADVEFESGVVFYIENLELSANGTKIEHVVNTDIFNLTVKGPNVLYKTKLVTEEGSSSVILNMVRETNYEKVFNDSRGKFLENIRQNNPDDRLLSVMDAARNMEEINSAMNSSYHFNPMVLMNPVKTINRGDLLGLFMNEQDLGAGIDVDYVFSNKLNDYGAHAYVSSKYNDLYFKIGGSLNHFSYKDNINEFDGAVYGLDIRAKQYIENIWLDGIVGINHAVFNVDNIYTDGNITNKPSGNSKYLRLSAGYDYKQIADFVISPFIGMMAQNVEIMGFKDNDVNLHAGVMGKYDFVMDGIKYEYGAMLATDEKLNWNMGLNIGFVSVVDNAGAHLVFDTFNDEFGTSYKFSIMAKVQF